jgi:hypothetical protein
MIVRLPEIVLPRRWQDILMISNILKRTDLCDKYPDHTGLNEKDDVDIDKKKW